MTEKAIETKADKLAEKVHNHAWEILGILGILGIFILVVFLLRNYRLNQALEKLKE